MRHYIVEFTMARHHGQQKIGYICFSYFFLNHHNVANPSQYMKKSLFSYLEFL